MKPEKIYRASQKEKVKYASRNPKPLYPLYGHVVLMLQEAGSVPDRLTCPIEDLRASDFDISFEILVPDGFMVTNYGSHGMVCTSLADLKETASRITLTKEV